MMAEIKNLDPSVQEAFTLLSSEDKLRSLKVIDILHRFGLKNTDLLAAAVLSPKAASLDPAEVAARFGAYVAKIVSALADANGQPLNLVLPMLSISNPEAATVKIAERTAEVEAAISAVAEGHPEAWQKFREEYASTLTVKIAGADALWTYLNGLCKFQVPSAAFRLGDVYIDYPFEDVKFRFEFKTGKAYRKFYGQAEAEIPASSKLFNQGCVAVS
jgi:hypothetical protein